MPLGNDWNAGEYGNFTQLFTSILMILMILSRRIHRPVGSVSASVLHCHGSQGGGASGLSVSEPVRRCLGSFGKPRMARRANEESPGLVGQREMEFVLHVHRSHTHKASLYSLAETLVEISLVESLVRFST